MCWRCNYMVSPMLLNRMADTEPTLVCNLGNMSSRDGVI